MSEALIVFPNAAQLEVVGRAAALTGRQLTVVLADGAAPPSVPGVVAVSASQAAARTSVAPGARVMCCHESGVYWVAGHRAAVGTPNFGEICLRLLLKSELAAELARIGVTVIDKYPLDQVQDRAALPYPLVVKPDFGFASMLVKRIADATALEEYETSFRELRERSLLAEYDDFVAAYPNADPCQVIAEPDLTAGTLFLTVPFLVRDGEPTSMYPIRGVGQRGDELTDFHWSAFMCGEEPQPAVDALERTLRLITKGLHLTGGVYEIEALYDERRDRLYVLEFSPRVTGGFIPELVRRSTGVDVELLGLLNFLGAEPPAGTVTEPDRHDPHLLMLLGDEDPEPEEVRDAEPVASRTRRLGTERFRDVIYRLPRPRPTGTAR